MKILLILAKKLSNNRNQTFSVVCYFTWKLVSLKYFGNDCRFFLCVIDIFSKYARVVPLKDERHVTIVCAFQKILDNSVRKTNKILVDKSSEFYTSFFKNG